MHWYTEILFSKDNIKQSSNNLDYRGQHYVGVYRENADSAGINTFLISNTAV